MWPCRPSYTIETWQPHLSNPISISLNFQQQHKFEEQTKRTKKRTTICISDPFVSPPIYPHIYYFDIFHLLIKFSSNLNSKTLKLTRTTINTHTNTHSTQHTSAVPAKIHQKQRNFSPHHTHTPLSYSSTSNWAHHHRPHISVFPRKINLMHWNKKKTKPMYECRKKTVFRKDEMEKDRTHTHTRKHKY